MIETKFLEWFQGLLMAESSSGTEHAALTYFENTLDIWPSSITWQRQEVSPRRFNLLGNFNGRLNNVLCSHIDTVKPYVSPRLEGDVMYGRGSCDAKGQIFTMLLLAHQLQHDAPSVLTKLGFLVVVGEETASIGAKTANALVNEVKNLIILEPTNNHLITAAKGGLKVKVSILGKTAHSGYPELGVDAIQLWIKFNEQLLERRFEIDPILGTTTFNWGRLSSDNASNVVPNLVTAELNWRTTFTSASKIRPWLESLSAAQPWLKLEFDAERLPFKFKTLKGFRLDSVAFGCDAPYLSSAKAVLMFGPGDIQVAHSANEKLNLLEAEAASSDLVRLLQQLD